MDVSVNAAMVTTAFELPGYRIAKSMGLVRGVTVRSRSILGTLGASLQTVVYGAAPMAPARLAACRQGQPSWAPTAAVGEEAAAGQPRAPAGPPVRPHAAQGVLLAAACGRTA